VNAFGNSNISTIKLNFNCNSHSNPNNLHSSENDKLVIEQITIQIEIIIKLMNCQKY